MRDGLGVVAQVVLTLIGLGFLALGVWTLYTPEEFLRKAALGKDEFTRLAVTVDARKLDPKNQGKPVIVTGEITTKSVIKDPVLGTSFPGAISVYREVKMHQYDERWEGSGDNERLVGHTQVWSEESEPCPSRPNPPMPLHSQLFLGTDYKVGVFAIPREMAAELDGKTVRTPSLKPESYAARLGVWVPGSQLIICDRGHRDGIGTLSLRYLVQEPCQVTVLGAQQGDRIEPYIDVSGGQTYALHKGAPTPASTRKASGEAELPSMGFARFLAFWPLWAGFIVLFWPRWGKRGKGLLAILAAMAVPCVMYLVNQAVWKLL